MRGAAQLAVAVEDAAGPIADGPAPYLQPRWGNTPQAGFLTPD